MKWFNDCQTLEEVKAQYKKIAKKYHPDLDGNTLTMQDVNKEYAFATAKQLRVQIYRMKKSKTKSFPPRHIVLLSSKLLI